MDKALLRTDPLLSLPQLPLKNSTKGLHPDDTPAGRMVDEKTLAGD